MNHRHLFKSRPNDLSAGCPLLGKTPTPHVCLTPPHREGHRLLHAISIAYCAHPAIQEEEGP